ncbi:MAG: fused MFS/spermidine synthase [Povalibacter sp.]
MAKRMAIYAATVVLSACLLFLIQPLITKIIFPWFGGASSVWIVALMFFQVCLLGGYSYAHWLTSRASPKRQMLIHAVVLIAACLTLPISPADAWRPQDSANPAAQILILLAANVGLPCLALSATSPLLQVWYVRERGTSIPLWLFAVSNFGSLAALLSFPLLFEPLFNTKVLDSVWSIGFALFAAMCIYVSLRQRLRTSEQSIATPREAAPPASFEMAFWVLLAAAASALLSASTVQLSTNVAPIPLLWVVPLAVYLLTFILSFSSRRVYDRKAFFPFAAASVACLAWLYIHSESHQQIGYVIPLYLICLFVLCMTCHGELALRAPTTRYLTRYYLLIALGGALGGIFVGVLAPMMFDTYLELPVLLIVLAELIIYVQWKRRGARSLLWPVRGAMILALLALAGSLLFSEARSREQNLLISRNFYGVLQVREFVENGRRRRSLVHGTIRHGYQFTDPAHRDMATSYYSHPSGIGRTLLAKQAHGPVRVGVVGLGAGTLLSYARPGDDFNVYEINRDVIDIANTQFTYLPAARSRRANIQIELGDARLTLEREAPQQFDLLAVDAFSSDAIPTHLLTREAFSVYVRHLKPDGVLAVHISNRYLNLEPVCEQAARQLNLSNRFVHATASDTVDASDWVLFTADQRLWIEESFAGAEIRPLQSQAGFKGWTDEYSSLWPVLKIGSEHRTSH